MISGSGHPLAYPVLTTLGALAICLAWAPYADLEQLSMLGAVAVVVLCYSAFRLAVASGVLPWHTPAAGRAQCRRVRQQHRLLSRSWLEFTADGVTRWLPVYFDPALVTLCDAVAEFGNGTVELGELRLYPSGAVRTKEPIGRLHDNPTRPDPDGPDHAAASARLTRRLLLDAQFAIAAPFAGLLWVYVAGGGFPAFAGAVTVAAGVCIWFAAIRGSDPS
ncbi:hypothetical protein ABIA39_002361 [Nocardia sp. GAS34]|uniref:hypothetical protein n=1 Tax=unclassified Nocardia TaxID=2637762 RepID=UPI003D204169